MGDCPSLADALGTTCDQYQSAEKVGFIGVNGCVCIFVDIFRSGERLRKISSFRKGYKEVNADLALELVWRFLVGVASCFLLGQPNEREASQEERLSWACSGVEPPVICRACEHDLSW